MLGFDNVTDNEAFGEFILDVSKELSGTANVYVKLAERYCEKYPALHPTTISFTINRLLAYCAMTGMLSAARIDARTSNEMMHASMAELLGRIYEYADKKERELRKKEASDE